MRPAITAAEEKALRIAASVIRGAIRNLDRATPQRNTDTTWRRRRHVIEVADMLRDIASDLREQADAADVI